MFDIELRLVPYYLTSCLRHDQAEPPALDSLVSSTLSIEIVLSKRKWINRLVVVRESSSMADLQRVMHIRYHGGLGTPIRANNSRSNSKRYYRL